MAVQIFNEFSEMRPTNLDELEDKVNKAMHKLGLYLMESKIKDWNTQLHQTNHYTCDPTASEKAINKWVSEKTQRKITNIVVAEDITQDTILFPINAVYFKGNWSNRFAEDYTKEHDFTFFFAIKDDKTGAMLFMGSIVEP